MRRVPALAALLAASVAACASTSAAPQLPLDPKLPSRQVGLPFPPGTQFKAAAGTYGDSPQWDFEVPLNTKVLAVEAGKVIVTFMPYAGEGACDPARASVAHEIRILHDDGTVASYAHVNVFVKLRQRVRKGQAIATTASNGYLCRPNLGFTLYRGDAKNEPGPGAYRVTPLFEGLSPAGLREGRTYRVP